MIRHLAFAAAMLAASAAAAQTSPELQRASQAVAAIWRPFDPAAVSPETFDAQCQGWSEEMAAVEAAIPEELTSVALAQVRASRGLIIVPAADDPAAVFVFPAADMTWFASGLGRISVLEEAQGYVGLQDALGQSYTLQLGRQARRPVMRLRQPGGEVISFVGCAPTLTP